MMNHNAIHKSLKPISCHKSENNLGFRTITGREHRVGAQGIVNAKSSCFDSTYEDLHGDMMSGGWNRELDCPKGERMVGFQIRKSSVYRKIINFRSQCARVEP